MGQGKAPLNISLATCIDKGIWEMWFYICVRCYTHQCRLSVSNEEETLGRQLAVSASGGFQDGLFTDSPHHQGPRFSISVLPSCPGPQRGCKWLCSSSKCLKIRCCVEEEEENDCSSAPLEMRKLKIPSAGCQWSALDPGE